MGQVGKARGTGLGRDVVLKVSKAEFTARVKQEARTIHDIVCQVPIRFTYCTAIVTAFD
jgi:hypothetical protein